MTREKREKPRCPCENCICVPVCRNKKYFDLSSCTLLIDYVDNYYRGFQGYDSTHRIEIYKILKPSRWKLTKARNVIDEDLPL